ncbi:conserved hypothetical protein [Ricinus communis]|uniref:PB1-like domain-containing protein n=1 Tax=Ricinus communis TaxID=3988 RepID=B9SBA2_RICCO|nr:conserved hypothetical protein [Ricinus communis]
MGDLYTMVLHHGGLFVENDIGIVEYEGGEFMHFDNCDLDKSGYLDILSDVRELGYSSLSKITYLNLEQGVFCFFYNNKGVMEMLSCVRDGVFHVYIEGELIVDFEGENDTGENGAIENDVESNDEAQPDEFEANVGASIIGETFEGFMEGNAKFGIDGASESEDPKYVLVQESKTNDGMNDEDFSSDDEKLLEVRRNLKWARYMNKKFKILMTMRQQADLSGKNFQLLKTGRK